MVDLKVIFWGLWEKVNSINPKLLDEMCADSEFAFDCFRNSVKMADDSLMLDYLNDLMDIIKKAKVKSSEKTELLVTTLDLFFDTLQELEDGR